MGSAAILVGAVGLASSLICVFGGYLWGRSNVRSQIEDALDKARISADAREFTLREQLDEKMVEVADLRARAEELPRLREQLEQLKSERMRGSAGGRVIPPATANNAPSEQTPPENVRQAARVPESADKAIQDLLKSIEERMKQAEKDPEVVVHESATPAVTNFAVEIPPTVTQLGGKSVPAELPTAKPAPPAKDEWQEFAASLAELKNRQK